MGGDDQLTSEQVAAEIHRIQHALLDMAPGGRGRRRDFDCPSIYEPDAFARAYHARRDELRARRHRQVGP